ncbi:Fatty aldehyde dehydrogenase [Trichinella pseudospiralis]|uniref:Aldehyde dehydrogenase n=2 Tax=Trichinella pseudospiralis TaxID=6337 RepID=A0A0V1HBV9_TRIPS|nr:Fatty aldehyde dehydrogenase [Trichinella pseudospiralis]KRZ08243.1 Fatty aldehyde dehydrogenase [Trichinella pseudospiralis]KRZ38365.1 Fatty aldehyde dehydrogenase [Trichinella pseudospiralis]
MAVNYFTIVESLRKAFLSGKTRTEEFRQKQLETLKRMLDEKAEDIYDALYKDLHKSKEETFFFEILFLYNEIEVAQDHLSNWMEPVTVDKNLLQLLDKAYIVKEPLGVVLIMSAWNYPIHLLLLPLVGALAAGNCVVLKPSEVAVNTEKLIANIIPQYFDPDVVRVISGGVAETTSLLQCRFDHIFYTGSASVGRIVMKAASEFLTPVTLELGGQCPAIVDQSATDLETVAKRIAWARCLNAGQTCTAPDYVLCHQSIKMELVEQIAAAFRKFYSSNAKQSKDYGRIINANRFRSIATLLQSCDILVGGRTDEADLYVEPTVVDAKLNDPILENEIFGPILPVVGVNNMDDAIEFIRSKEKPLAVYLFSTDEKMAEKIKMTTSSGALVLNDAIVQMALETLPFGGVGNSGIGRYHGKYSFDTFTHEKSILERPLWGEKLLWMRYPPFDSSKVEWAKRIFTRQPLPPLKLTAFMMLVIFFILLFRCFL